MDTIDIVKSRLSAAMAARGVRQSPLAIAAGLNESAVRDVIRGRSRNPGVVTLSRIAQVLNVNVATLISDQPTWPVVGMIDDTAALRSLTDQMQTSTEVASPFMTEVSSDYAVAVNGGAALRPFSDRADYLLFRPREEGYAREDIGRPCLCRREDGVLQVRTPTLGDKPGLFHLRPIDPFGSPELNTVLVSAARIELVLPEAFTKSAIPLVR